MKTDLTSEMLLYPCPVVLVTSKLKNIENVLAVSWIGIASSHPEYLTMAIKTTRLSHSLILSSGVFTVNIPNKDLLNKVDYCGTFSGRNTNKFDDCEFTSVPGKCIDVPMIDECPVNIECAVHQTLDLGSHTLIVGKVLGKYIDDGIKLHELHESLTPVVYFRPNYYGLEKEKLGAYGQLNKTKGDG